MSENNGNLETIFVSIASYCDVDLKNTVQNILLKATFPDRVFLGICMQNGGKDVDEYSFISSNTNEIDPNVTKAIQNNQIRSITLLPKEASGPTYARFLCSKFWQGEDYYFQVDSHCRFCKGWDVEMINMYYKFSNYLGNPNILFSTYVRDTGDYERNENGEIEKLLCPVMSQAFITGFGTISFHGAPCTMLDDAIPRLVPMIAAGFQFSKAMPLLEKVPFDPFLLDLFVGEEILYSARVWTSGFDIVPPNRNICFHTYTRAQSPHFWDVNLGQERDDSLAYERAQWLLGKSSKTPRLHKYKSLYGLGNVRSIDDFWLELGVDWQNMTITKNFVYPKPVEPKCEAQNPDSIFYIQNSLDIDIEQYTLYTSFLLAFIIFGLLIYKS